MINQLFIPEKLKVGFQNRNDTYTKSLAYIIYYDQSGKLRKEVSWEGWRDKQIDPQEFENKPTEGFVLNKGVKRYETNRSLIRVFDPRGFEFEISIPNLIFILTQTDCGRKGLEGEFVYAWDQKELVLLPVKSEEYDSCIKYTKLQFGKITTKDLVEGCIYETNRQNKLIYIGKLDYYIREGIYENREVKEEYYHNLKRIREKHVGTKYLNKKSFIFYNENHKDFEIYNTLSSFKSKLSFSPVQNYSELFDFYKTKEYSQKFIGFSFEPLDIEEEIKTIMENPSSYYHWNKNIYYEENGLTHVSKLKLKSKYNHVTTKYEYSFEIMVDMEKIKIDIDNQIIYDESNYDYKIKEIKMQQILENSYQTLYIIYENNLKIKHK